MAKRGGKKFRGGRGGGRGGGRRGGGRTDRADYGEVTRSNALFERYYNTMGIVSNEESEELWTTLRRELPSSFRFTGSRGHALSVQQLLQSRYIPELSAIEYEGKPVEPPKPLPWYPDDLAYQMDTPKQVLRRSPPFASFKKFLVSETSVGNISRQEAVSMIPPLLMDIKPGMVVLDVCAAPGSKSAQLVEIIHAGEEARIRSAVRNILKQEGRELSPDGDEVKLETVGSSLDDDPSDDGRATGLLVANDVDYKRAHLLIHQVKRLNSPNLIITNHDATAFPSIKLPADPGADDKQPVKYLKYDRILADVPCTGDGTPRKNVMVWKNWTPLNAIGLHATQVRILVRSLQLLKPGGRVVYSTCSMNPIENEAVVKAAVDRCGGLDKVEIIDCTSELPELKRSPGLKSWSVMDKTGELWESWKEVSAAKEKGEVSEEALGKMSEQMFAPSEDTDIPLERCMRVYPHQQDTGGFFITVLQKRTEIRARPENPAKNEAESENHPVGPIAAALTELESKTNGTNPGEHIEALDALAPPQTDNTEVGDASAAARQNMENIDMPETNPKKHQLDDMADAAASVKKPKFREEIDSAAIRGEEDRQVHYPPPPSVPVDTRTQSSLAPSGAKRDRSQQFEEPFKYLDPKHEVITEIFEFYNINPQFPRSRFMVRNASNNPAKTIYYTSSLARDILTENEGKGIKFVHCGIKMFVKQEVQSPEVCRWRIQTDGLPLIESWLADDRVMRLTSRKTFRALLVEMFPKVTGGAHNELGEIGSAALDMSMGCCVLRIEKGEGEDSFKERIVLPIWRSKHSLNLMLPKEERKATLLRLYNDETPLQDHSKDRFLKRKDGSDIDSDAEVKKEAEEKEDVAAQEQADEVLAADVDKEAQLEVDMELGTKDEEDIKQELKEQAKADS